MRRDVLAATWVLLAAASCDVPRTPALAPDRIAVDDQGRTLRLGGLDPADFLDPHGGRLGLHADFAAVIGGVPTSVLAADGAGVDLQLTTPLPLGLHDLALTSGGRAWSAAGALRVVEPGADVDAGLPGDGGLPGDAALVSCPGQGALVACYPFDGDTADASPNQLDAIAVDTSFVAGPLGQAVDLISTSRLEVEDDSALDVDKITLQAWVYLRAYPTGGAGRNRAMVVNSNLQYGLWINPAGTLTCWALASATTNAPIPLNTWTHLACTYDEVNMRIYVDGQLVEEQASTLGIPTLGTRGLSIGGDNPSGENDRLDGLLDELRLYRIARSAAELCADAGQATCP